MARDPWTDVLQDLDDGDADVALGGIWAPAMYAGRGRDLVTIGQLNARFPMVLLTREPVEYFDWTWTKGKTVLVPGAGGTAMYEFTAGVMRESGAEPAEVRFVRDLSSQMLSELFEHGLGDALLVDLLAATVMHERGTGYLTCRLADAGGPMPNSVYYVRRERLDDLHDRLVKLMAGINEAMIALNSGAHSADVLAAEWPLVPVELLQAAAAELIASGTWSDVRIDASACDRWVSILRAGGLVTTDISFPGLVDTRALDAIASFDRM